MTFVLSSSDGVETFFEAKTETLENLSQAETAVSRAPSMMALRLFSETKPRLRQWGLETELRH
jgi:hypothetical protein